MQKIDFVNNLETIVVKLKSAEIVNVFKNGFASPGQAYSYGTINPLLFVSKSNYDQIKEDNRYIEILAVLNAGNIYSENNLSTLTEILRTTQASNILLQPIAVALYNFHNSLIQTLQLSKNVLEKKEIRENLINEGENGIVIFQVLIEGDGLKTEKYIKIFTALNELVEAISKIVNETEEQSEIILLDSGSDSNVGIKTGIETAKSLYLIFKEIWVYIVDFRFYKQKQKNEALLESLSIRTEIQKKIDDGILSPEEGKEYIHFVKTRTDTLIGLKVLPKKIVLDTNQFENRKLLSDIEGINLLSGGE